MTRKGAIALLSVVTLILVVFNIYAIPRGWYVFLNGLLLFGYIRLVIALWDYIF